MPLDWPDAQTQNQRRASKASVLRQRPALHGSQLAVSGPSLTMPFVLMPFGIVMTERKTFYFDNNNKNATTRVAPKVGKAIGIIVFSALYLGAVVLAFCWPAQPKLIVPLADGSNFVLVGTDSGRKLFYGGGRWQRLLCKALGRKLPAFVHNQPEIYPSIYTNGIALYFRREEPDRQSLPTPWNGTGQLYFLDDFGMEHWIQKNHCVNFVVEKRGQVDAVVEENMDWEMPLVHDPELRLRIRETNNLTGSVSTHNFRIKNPAL
jgi:hypothetical protein